MVHWVLGQNIGLRVGFGVLVGSGSVVWMGWVCVGSQWGEWSLLLVSFDIDASGKNWSGFVSF